ncbi:hypothetical protein ONE63_001649 [Megalurothrips usitatus]|uniref:Acyl-CoA Delta(11) desaturase-like n=1 Tax=Megalurothrips usitatus TaxID=439358 RepID=A0AAV7XCT4_9NEOP|nr:hypothetical protein ONE63_001649 [Megalurothrips usitatus]
MALLFCYVIPTSIPYFFWGETITNALLVAGHLRHMAVLHFTFFVNSAAHSFNYKPYDKSIRASHVPSLSVLTLGEGWHNYHHCFPWDYKTSEFGRYSTNLTTAFIDLMAKIGWAYDLRTASPAVIERRIEKTGEKALRGGS